jgi:hypothetical protein
MTGWPAVAAIVLAQIGIAAATPLFDRRSRAILPPQCRRQEF